MFAGCWSNKEDSLCYRWWCISDGRSSSHVVLSAEGSRAIESHCWDFGGEKQFRNSEEKKYCEFRCWCCQPYNIISKAKDFWCFWCPLQWVTPYDLIISFCGCNLICIFGKQFYRISCLYVSSPPMCQL